MVHYPASVRQLEATTPSHTPSHFVCRTTTNQLPSWLSQFFWSCPSNMLLATLGLGREKHWNNLTKTCWLHLVGCYQNDCLPNFCGVHLPGIGLKNYRGRNVRSIHGRKKQTMLICPGMICHSIWHRLYACHSFVLIHSRSKRFKGWSLYCAPQFAKK